MTSALVKLAAQGDQAAPVELPFHPYVFGIVAFAIFLTLLIIAYAFRSVWTRH